MKRGQSDFSLGQIAAGSSPEKMPAGSCLLLVNMMVDDEASLRRRGGCEYVTSEDAGLADLPLALWDGFLAGGQRTVLAGPDGLWVVAADGSTPVQLSSTALSAPRRGAVHAGIVTLGNGVFYGGSRETADYSTGSVTITAGSKAVAGSGTTWVGNVDAGMIFESPDGVIYTVESVESNTALTLTSPAIASEPLSGGYTARRTATGALLTALAGGNVPAAAYSGLVASVAGRLVLVHDGKVYFSDGPHPDYGTPRWTFPAKNVHELPDGAEERAVATLGDRLFVFTSAGVFVISGMAQEIVGPDGAPQHRIDHYADTVAVDGGAGITRFRDSLVVPAVDDIYLIDGFARPVAVAASARADWRLLMGGGNVVPGGGAIYRGHYVLPLLLGGSQYVTWVFRLDRLTETRLGIVAPWTTWSGQAGKLGAVAVRSAEDDPVLLAAGLDGAESAARVLDLTPAFDQGETNEKDAGGAAVVGTIDPLVLDGGRGALWRLVRIRYRLSDTGATVTPEVVLTHRPGGDATPSSLPSGTTETAEAGAEAFALEVYTWAIQRQSEFLRLRLTITGGTEFVLHAVEAVFFENRRLLA